MAGKRDSENKKPRKHKIKKSSEESSNDDNKGTRQENDFGGIPSRDLKKNLGCGG